MTSRARSIPTLLAGLLLTTSAHAAPSGLEVANRDLQATWQRDALPKIEAALAARLQAEVGKVTRGKRTRFEVLELADLRIDLARAPGLPRIDPDALEVRIPVEGSWGLRVAYRVGVRYHRGALSFRKKLRVEARVRDLSASLRFDLDATDPGRPKIAAVHPPRLRMKVEVSTSKGYLAPLVAYLNHRLEEEVRAALRDVVASVDPARALLLATPSFHGAGAPATQQPAPATPAGPAVADLELAAAKLHELIVGRHLPFGSLVNTEAAAGYRGTWRESLADPNFTDGPVVRYGSLKDSAIWSGHWLAACALRYAATGSSEALADARAMVEVFGHLLRIRGVPGLLQRAMTPLAEFPHLDVAGDPLLYVETYRGVDYVCFDFISRDQYMGVFYGLATAYDLIPDAALRDQARECLELALDYLLANGWTARMRDGSLSASWAGTFSHQLAWVTAAHRANPAKYAATLADHAGLADVLWVEPWTTTFDPLNNYFKYNLTLGALHTLMRQETDPARFMSEARGMRILRGALEHHGNPYFDLLTHGGDPSLPVSSDFVRSALEQLLERPRRVWSEGCESDPAVEKVTFTAPSALLQGSQGTRHTGAHGGVVQRSATEVIAKYPLPIARRRANDFLWQGDPFRLKASGHDVDQGPGLDLYLTYWMARHAGALP